MSKKILISGLVGALVFTGVGFGTESTGSRFLGPVEVNASEVTSPVLSDTQAKFDSLFNKDLAISKEIELLRLDNLSNEYSIKRLEGLNSVTEASLKRIEGEVVESKKRMSAIFAEKTKLDGEFTKAKAELTALKKREAVLATSKKAADVKELASVRKSIGSVNVKIDGLRAKLHFNSIALYNEMELVDKFSREATALKPVAMQTKGRYSSDLRILDSNKTKLFNLDAKKRNISKMVEELRAPVAKESIEKNIIRFNGTKSVKTTEDLKKDLEVVEVLLGSRNGTLATLRVSGNASLLEYTKVVSDIGVLSQSIAGAKHERGDAEMDLALLNARIEHLEVAMSTDRKKLKYLSDQLDRMKSEVHKLSKSKKSEDKDRVIELQKDIRNANSFADHIRKNNKEIAYKRELVKRSNEKARLADVNKELIALEGQKRGLKARMDLAVTNKLASDARVANEQGYINEIIKYRDALKAKIGK